MRLVKATTCFLGGFLGCAVGIGVLLGACAGANDTPGDDGDTDAPPFIPDPVNTACKHVDLLFSIDASSSMVQEVEALSRDVFPLFADRLSMIGQGTIEDYRIGVIDACPAPSNLHSQGQMLDGSGTPVAVDCAFESGKPWMESKSSNLDDEFGCATSVFTLDQDATCASVPDQDERPAYAAYSALSQPARDTVNAGFLRDDALLVVVAITDEDEEIGASLPGPITQTKQIYDDLVSIKGDVKDMVFLGIGGAPATGDSCDGQYGAALKAIVLKSVTDMFIAEERGVYWDLCSGRLEDGITEAIKVIERGCNIVK